MESAPEAGPSGASAMEEGERPGSGLSYADAQGLPLGLANFYGPDENVEEEVLARMREDERVLRMEQE